MSKAERRALQEAQRAAKAAAKGGPAASGGGGGGGAAPAADSKPLQKQGSGTNLARQGAPVSRQSSFAKQEAEGKGAASAAAGGEQQQGKGGSGCCACCGQGQVSRDVCTPAAAPPCHPAERGGAEGPARWAGRRAGGRGWAS